MPPGAETGDGLSRRQEPSQDPAGLGEDAYCVFNAGASFGAGLSWGGA